jgi:hypothetical protein
VRFCLVIALQAASPVPQKIGRASAACRLGLLLAGSAELYGLSAHSVFDIQSCGARTSGRRRETHRDGAVPACLGACSAGRFFTEVARSVPPIVMLLIASAVLWSLVRITVSGFFAPPLTDP